MRKVVSKEVTAGGRVDFFLDSAEIFKELILLKTKSLRNFSI